MAMIPVASVAQSQPGVSQGLPSAAIPKTTKGVVLLVEAKTEGEARDLMETLPLAKEHLIDDQYIPVGPLMPLRMLVGPGAQQ